VSTALATRVSVRQATPADNPELCRLFAGITMKTDLELSIRRDPDFLALYRMQTDAFECWVGGEDGAIEGCGALLARDGYLDGQVVRVGYLGDLRVARRLQGRRLLGELYGPVLRQFSQATGCQAYLTTIIASNATALWALTGETGRRLGMPPYTLLRKFDIRAVHLTIPRPTPKTGFTVRRAADADIPDLAWFLDADARRRPFGFLFTEAELRRRLANWPGLRISDFYLAHGRDGALAGCCAIWDAAPIKRPAVVAYRGSMGWIKRAYNAGAAALGYQRLPEPGEVLRSAYVTHQAVPSEDPQVWRALLHAVYRDSRRSGRHFLSVCVLEDDPLAPAYRGYLTTNLPAHLYAVTPPGQDLPAGALRPGRPGFEMALV
jgi:hypothetical protein